MPKTTDKCLPSGVGGGLSCNQIAFSVWEDLGECPHCGYPDIEYETDNWNIWMFCDDCLKTSAFSIADVDTLINNHYEDWKKFEDSFELEEIFDKDNVGGE